MNLINAKIFDGEKIIENGFVSFENGKITEVGKMSDFNKQDFTNLSGSFVFPGLIDAHSHLGMWGNASGFENDDGNEATDPLTPHLFGSDGVKIFDKCFEEAISAGITTVLTGPGSANAAGGIYAAFHTAGELETRLYKQNAGLKIAFGENPKSCYKNKGPQTRMATAALLRELFIKAENYAEEKAKKDGKSPAFDIKLEAVCKVLNGEMPVFAHAHKAEDILTAVKLSKEFKFRLVIVHGTDAAKIKEYLSKNNVPVLCGPIICDRSKPELESLSPETIGILDKEGVKCAVITDHPVIPIQYLALSAAVSVKNGLDRISAYKAMTSTAAELSELSEKGYLKAGMDADIAIFNGDPLDVMTSCTAAYIQGKKVF